MKTDSVLALYETSREREIRLYEKRLCEEDFKS